MSDSNLTNWYEEKRSAYIYQFMAEQEANLLHKKLFMDLQQAAEKQASLWAEKLNQQGLTSLPSYKPDFRTRIILTLVKYLGTENMHPVLSSMKIRGMSIFNTFHNEHKHTSLRSINNLRAAIFGVTDGMVSNVSLILGIVGAQANQHFIILTGIAGLLAGACSMGAGEYISVRSQREVYEYQIAIEKQEFHEYPEEEMQELSLIYQARGIPEPDANKLAKFMISNPETGLATLAREELGLNPDDLVSPMGAMLSSFFSFAIGAFVPLLPFFVTINNYAVFSSVGLTALSLFLIGMCLSLFTNRNPFLLGMRMLFVGILAGSVTFVIGALIGVRV
jgi:VIT1/CCC1 family predicted Fe2+/Mn2+ transporter